MAESLVALTEGAGKNLHTFQRTIGASTVEDQAVLLAEQYLASYSITGDASTATANSHLIQAMAGASLKLRLRYLIIHQTVAATTAALMSILIIRVTSAGTGGTAITPQPLDPTDAAAGATSQTLPTVKGSEAASSLFTAAPYMLQTIAATQAQPNPIYVLDVDRLRSKPIIIAAGATNGLVVKNITAIAGATVRINLLFDESNF